MGRAPCCDEKLGLKKGPWTPDEDHKLVSHIRQHGHGSWRSLPQKAGLKRCGKSCRLRWTNYLRPDIKRGRFSFEEERIIIQLHAILGNRWSAIASHLPRRTDNEIKNYWNTHLKKRLTQMGIDPITHQRTLNIAGTSNSSATSDLLPALSSTTSTWTPMLTHMTQWDLTLAETEARLNSRRHNVVTMSSVPPPTHPSAFFMTCSWKTKLPTKFIRSSPPVKLEPDDFHAQLDHSVLAQNDPGVVTENVMMGDEIFVPNDCRLYGWSDDDVVMYPPSSVFGEHFQSQSTSSMAESPTSILHGPDEDATTSPCGSTVTTSDCLDLSMILAHQSGEDSAGFQTFPALSEPQEPGSTFWHRHQLAGANNMVELGAMEGVDHISVLGSSSNSEEIGCLELDVVPSLDFNGAAFPPFEILCQGDHQQYEAADCVRQLER